MAEGPQWVYEASNVEEAHIVQGRLEASGIPSYLEYRGLGSPWSGLGRVRVMVPGPFAPKARWLLAQPPDED